MRRQDASLLATIAFMLCVTVIALGLSLRKAVPGPELGMALDETTENAR